MARQYQKAFADQKDDVWRAAWNEQQGVYVWPTENQLDKKMLYPTEAKNLPLPDRTAYKQVYPAQFATLMALVAPAMFNGDAVGFEVMMAPSKATDAAAVSSGRGGFTAPPATSGDKAEGTALKAVFKDDPTAEEIWIAQEDYWVKRGLLNILRAAQQSAGRFTLIADKDAPKNVHRFQNGIWEIKLIIDQTKTNPASTIKNISASRTVQALASSRGSKGLMFRLTQGNSQSVPLVIEGEPLAYGESRELKKAYPLAGLDPAKEFGLEEELDWNNAPVRRVDALLTGKHSHRTAKAPLVPHPAFKATGA